MSAPQALKRKVSEALRFDPFETRVLVRPVRPFKKRGSEGEPGDRGAAPGGAERGPRGVRAEHLLDVTRGC